MAKPNHPRRPGRPPIGRPTPANRQAPTHRPASTSRSTTDRSIIDRPTPVDRPAPIDRSTLDDRTAPARRGARAGRLGAALLAVAVLATGLVAGAPARPAWAHARLVSTDPAADAVVGHQVTSVALTFNGPVQAQFSTVVVTGADQVSHSAGGPQAADRTLTQPVTALPPGPVRVVWRTVSADGHPVEGQFRFTGTWPAAGSVVPPVATPPAAATGPASAPGPSLAGVASRQPAGDDGPASRFLLLGGVLLVAIAGAAWWLWRRRRVS